MNNNRKRFYNRVVETLNKKLKNIKDTSFYISPLWQLLEKCESYGLFLSDVDKHECVYIECIDLKTIIVAFDDNSDIYNPYTRKYILAFYQMDDFKGYCQCEPGMDGYNEEYQCCGHDCDWSIPTLEIQEVISNPIYKWEGDESTYWEFEKEFLKEHKEQEILLINDLLEKAEDDLASANKKIEKLKRRKEELEHGTVH